MRCQLIFYDDLPTYYFYRGVQNPPPHATSRARCLKNVPQRISIEWWLKLVCENCSPCHYLLILLLRIQDQSSVTSTYTSPLLWYLARGRYPHSVTRSFRKRAPCSPTTPEVKSTRSNWSGEGRNCSLNPSGSGEAGADEGCVIYETGVYWAKISTTAPIILLIDFIFFFCAVTCGSLFFYFKMPYQCDEHGLHESTLYIIVEMIMLIINLKSISSSDWSDGIIHLGRVVVGSVYPKFHVQVLPLTAASFFFIFTISLFLWGISGARHVFYDSRVASEQKKTWLLYATF